MPTLPYAHGLRDTVYGDYTDDQGNTSGYYYDRPYYADLISQGIDVFGNRNRGNQYRPQQYPAGYPQQQFNAGGLNTSGVQVNWWVVGGVLAALLIFQSGRRR